MMTWLPKDIEDAEQRIDGANTDNFANLVKIAGLDPKQHLRFADWSEVDFSGSDLRGFDLTGARLNGCRFDRALMDGARFDQAEVDGANLRAALDWQAYRRNWVKPPQAVRSDHLPIGAVFQDAPFAPEMVVVPPGRFWMGSELGEGEEDRHPRHEVTIPCAIAVGRYSVTFEEWDFAQGGKEWRRAAGVKALRPDEGWGRDRRPVINVSWEDAKAYANWLSQKTGLDYRLLAEAEWEYACRAGNEAAYCFDDSQELLGNYAWYASNSGRCAHPVGEKRPNKFGLYDMHGNVWEWCEDLWNDNYGDKPENLKETGGAWTAGDYSRRVFRGGSWGSSPVSCRSVNRNWDLLDKRSDYIGFRIARTLSF